MNRIILRTTCGLLAVATCSAQLLNLQSMYNSFASGSAKPDLAAITQSLSEDVQKLSSDDLNQMVAIIQRCLDSKDSAVRNSAEIYLTSLVTTRYDNAGALEPFIPYLAHVLEEPGNTSRKFAIYVLGSGLPKPSQAAVAALRSHLEDKNNTDEQFVMIAAGLLMAEPSNSATVHAVIANAKRHDGPGDMGSIISTIAMSGATDPVALEYVHDGLHVASAEIRRVTLEAISRMPATLRKDFMPDLQRLIADPDITEQLRDLARKVMIQ